MSSGPSDSTAAEVPPRFGPFVRLRSALAVAAPAMLALIGWPVITFGGLQAIRLVTNIILSHLLNPAIFGVLLILNTLRTGIELLSDVGVGQNIISHPAGSTPRFTSTAWTIQIIRGVLIGAVLATCSPLIAHIYAEPILAKAVPMMALLVVISGFQSTGLFVLMREQRLAQFSAFELLPALAAMVIQVTISYFDRTVWSLLYGAVICMAMQVGCSFFMTPSAGLRLAIDRDHARSIIHFGKWIFLSSAIFFIAGNFDRLYLSSAIPWALLGVYGIARSLSEAFTVLLARVGNMVLFPIIAGSSHRGEALRHRLSAQRVPLLATAAVGLALFIALSDRLVFLLYDQRYHEAAAILPVLAAGVWFSMLATLGEAVSLGIGRPQIGTLANAAKLAWMMAGMPLLAARFGFPGLVACIAAADLVKYLALSLGQKRWGLAFPVQDLALTGFFVVCVLVLRALFSLSGVVGAVGGLWALFQ
jgi:O-antigen/teichoic acid export membrane protein